MNDTEKHQLANRVADFLTRYRTEMSDIASYASHVFEAACFILIVRYYETVDYNCKPENLQDGKFKFRYSTAGYPWNFSFFTAFSGDPDEESSVPIFEIRHNQKVAGAWVEAEDDTDNKALFAVDAAVVNPGSLPDLPKGQKRTSEPYWVENRDVITFMEAKKLTAYPMLLAQFLGIVHEIKPEFLGIKGKEIDETFYDQQHPPPILMTANHLTKGTQKVLRSFEERGLLIRVVEDVTGLPDCVLIAKLASIEPEQSIESGIDIPF